MSPLVKKFLQTVGALAAQVNAPVLIVVRDPTTRSVHFVGTPGALENMRPEIAQKITPQEEQNVGVTGWDG